MENVFLLETEQPGDSFFAPTGVVIVGEKQKIMLYCQNSAHNLYKTAIVRNDWVALEKGVEFREIGFRLRNVTMDMAARGWVDTNDIPDVLLYVHNLYPRHLYFLNSVAAALR